MGLIRTGLFTSRNIWSRGKTLLIEGRTRDSTRCEVLHGREAIDCVHPDLTGHSKERAPETERGRVTGPTTGTTERPRPRGGTPDRNTRSGFGPLFRETTTTTVEWAATVTVVDLKRKSETVLSGRGGHPNPAILYELKIMNFWNFEMTFLTRSSDTNLNLHTFGCLYKSSNDFILFLWLLDLFLPPLR